MATQQPRPDPSADWWTTSEVAAYLGLQVATVSSYRSRGQMPLPDLTVGRTHVWRPSTITDWHRGRPRPGVGGRPGAGAGNLAAAADQGVELLLKVYAKCIDGQDHVARQRIADALREAGGASDGPAAGQ